MKCFIRANNIELPVSLRRFIVNRIEKTFSRVNDKVRFVVVSFQDINGFRGGNDKRCKVKVIGENSIQVHVFDTHSCEKTAFSKALKRAQQSFQERIQKLAHRLRRNVILVP